MLFRELVALLESTGYQVYDTDVPVTPTFPYIIVWGGVANPHVEESLDAFNDGVQDRVGVTVAAGTPAGVRLVHSEVSALLRPGGYPLTIAGYQLKHRDHNPVQVDRDEVLAGTNRHPAYCVDNYDVAR